MNQKDFSLGLACKDSKEFMDMCAVYFMHHLGINHKDIQVIWNPETHTSYLELRIHFIAEGKLRGLLPDRHVNGTMKLTLDNGWDWIQIELDNLSENDLKEHFICLGAFIIEVKQAYPDMFGEFNPSERDSND
jgi:hypothetical protein